MRDKSAVGADLYLEDNPDNIKALRNDGHKTIVVVNSMNRDLPGPRADNWEQIEKLVLREHKNWKKEK